MTEALNFRCRHRYPGGFELDAAFDTDQLVTALFGPSGSGKTSILYLIAGLLRPEQGTIRMAGRTLLDTKTRIHLKPEQRHLGVVFQEHFLFPHLNVEANLRYGERRRRPTDRRIDCGRVVEVLELGELLSRFPRNLSGGERQRVALGRSLLSGPEWLLMDEPLAALDEALKARILTYLERVVSEWHIPTIYVSHVAAEVRRLASQVVVLNQGHVESIGPVDAALPIA